MWGLPRPAPDEVVREDDDATFSQWKAVFPPEVLNERLLTHGPVVPGRVAHLAWSDNSHSTGTNPDGALQQLDIYTAAVPAP